MNTRKNKKVIKRTIALNTMRDLMTIPIQDLRQFHTKNFTGDFFSKIYTEAVQLEREKKKSAHKDKDSFHFTPEQKPIKKIITHREDYKNINNNDNLKKSIIQEQLNKKQNKNQVINLKQSNKRRNSENSSNYSIVESEYQDKKNKNNDDINFVKPKRIITLENNIKQENIQIKNNNERQNYDNNTSSNTSGTISRIMTDKDYIYNNNNNKHYNNDYYNLTTESANDSVSFSKYPNNITNVNNDFNYNFKNYQNIISGENPNLYPYEEEEKNSSSSNNNLNIRNRIPSYYNQNSISNITNNTNNTNSSYFKIGEESKSDFHKSSNNCSSSYIIEEEKYNSPVKNNIHVGNEYIKSRKYKDEDVYDYNSNKKYFTVGVSSIKDNSHSLKNNFDSKNDIVISDKDFKKSINLNENTKNYSKKISKDSFDEDGFESWKNNYSRIASFSKDKLNDYSNSNSKLLEQTFKRFSIDSFSDINNEIDDVPLSRSSGTVFTFKQYLNMEENNNNNKKTNNNPINKKINSNENSDDYNNKIENNYENKKYKKKSKDKNNKDGNNKKSTNYENKDSVIKSNSQKKNENKNIKNKNMDKNNKDKNNNKKNKNIDKKNKDINDNCKIKNKDKKNKNTNENYKNKSVDRSSKNINNKDKINNYENKSVDKSNKNINNKDKINNYENKSVDKNNKDKINKDKISDYGNKSVDINNKDKVINYENKNIKNKNNEKKKNENKNNKNNKNYQNNNNYRNINSYRDYYSNENDNNNSNNNQKNNSYRDNNNYKNNLNFQNNNNNNNQNKNYEKNNYENKNIKNKKFDNNDYNTNNYINNNNIKKQNYNTNNEEEILKTPKLAPKTKTFNHCSVSAGINNSYQKRFKMRKLTDTFHISNEISDHYPIQKIIFTLRHQTHFGEDMAMSGSVLPLGNWNEKFIMPLKWTKGNIWTGEIEINNQLSKEFEFKFVITKDKKVEKWEDGWNHKLNLDDFCKEISKKSKGKYNGCDYEYDEKEKSIKLKLRMNKV